MSRARDFTIVDVERNIRAYMESEDGRSTGRQPDDRFASFDYCFNYFQSFREQGRIHDISSPQNIQHACLHIAFYLASWGMLRGSSFLLKKSMRYYCSLVQTIVDLDRRLWDIDVDSYTEDNVTLLLEAVAAIRRAVSTEHSSSDTLVTKIMLGVFGNIPAFDTYFSRGLGVWTLSRTSLRRVAEFYHCHREAIDEYAASIHTLDFLTGEDTERHYTKAKIVDMVGFMEG